MSFKSCLKYENIRLLSVRRDITDNLEPTANAGTSKTVGKNLAASGLNPACKHFIWSSGLKSWKISNKSILSGSSKREAREGPLSFLELFSMKGGFRSSELDGVSMHNCLEGSCFLNLLNSFSMN